MLGGERACLRVVSGCHTLIERDGGSFMLVCPCVPTS